MVEPKTTPSFGYWVRRQRMALDLTQADLARAVNCARITIAKIEHDERRPSRQLANLLADHLAIPANQRARFVAAALGERSVEHLPLAQQPLAPVIPMPSAHPQLSTVFVGRRRELAEVLLRLHDPACRLLTIVGPGGIGKTRLALEAARRLAEHGNGGHETRLFADGVYFVPLQPVSRAERLVPVIADVLGLQSGAGEPPLQQVIHFLQNKKVLLVLDNFEHLLEGAESLTAILAAASHAKALVTSREALRLQEEWFYPLTGMRLPPVHNVHALNGNSSGAAARHIESDAMQLFVQSARRAQARFDPVHEQEAIARICQLVDGIPLALELAAAWSKVLPCAQIGDEIERGLDILVTRQRNVEERHRSMRLILDQSWQRLSAVEQQAVRRLAVFQGGFRHDGAAAVEINLATLAELVDKAWIYAGADGRYTVHELIKQYAAEKLDESPPLKAATRDRHMRFYLHEVAALEPALLGPEQRGALDWIANEIANVVAAWTRAVSNDQALVASALQALHLFFQLRSRYAEGKQLFASAVSQCATVAGQEATAQPGAPPAERIALRLRLLARLGIFYTSLGEFEPANTCFDTVVADCADQRELALVHIWMGNIAKMQSQRAAAEAELRASLELARAVNDGVLMVEALHALSEMVASFGDFAEAEQYSREALALCRELGRPDLSAKVLIGLAWPVNSVGRYAESEGYYRESLSVAESIGNPESIAIAEELLGWVAYCDGNARLAEAAAYYERALAIWRRIGHRSQLTMTLGDYGLVACEQEQYAKARRLAQEGLAIAEVMGSFEMIVYLLNVLALAGAGLGEMAASRQYLRRALQISYERQSPDKVDLTLYSVAKLSVREITVVTPASTRAKGQKALELLAFVVEHPATWQPIRDRAERLLASLAAQLPAKAAAETMRHGRERSYNELAVEVLGSLKEE